MNEEKSILIRIDDDGNASLYKEPYATVEVQTKEDFEFLKKVTALCGKLKGYEGGVDFLDDEKDPTCYIKRLLYLVMENPDLPIVPLVDGDVVGDDECGSYIAKFKFATVDKYIVAENSGECEFGEMFCYSDKHDYDEGVWETLCAVYGDDECENRFEGKSDEEIQEAFENLKWKEAILVHITTATWEAEEDDSYNSFPCI